VTEKRPQDGNIDTNRRNHWSVMLPKKWLQLSTLELICCLSDSVDE